MPTMPRTRSKATKIALAILGKPQNFKKRSKKQQYLDKRLLMDETVRVR